MERITFREWIICLTTVSCVVSLFFISTSFERRILQESVSERELKQVVKVFISGAVLRPGEYEVEVGTSLKRVLDKAGLIPSSNKKSLYLKKTLLAPCEISVPEKGCQLSRNS